MLKLKSKFFTSLLSLSLCVCFMPSSAMSAPIEFNYQSVYTGPHVFNIETAIPWFKNLEKTSKGDLKGHFFYDGGITKANDAPHAIMAGTLDMLSQGPTYTEDVTSITAFSALPTRDAIHSTKFLNKLYNDNKDVQDELAKVGKVLNMWASDRAAFFSTVGPIKSPADLKGKRVLVWMGPQVAQVKAWGGIPVQIIPMDSYLGLQRGMGEVLYCPLPAGNSMKIMEVAKDVTPMTTMTAFVFTWISWDLWNDMSSAQQKIVEDGTKAWGVKTGDDLVRSTNLDIEIMKKAGCTFQNLTETQLKAFQDPVIKVSIDYMDAGFKRYGVKKDAKQWTTYLQKLLQETL